MPTLEDLDALKTQINQLGGELRLLAERGETFEDVTPPEVPVDPDLERMLNEESSAGLNEMEALLGNYSEEFGETAVPGEEPGSEDIPGIDSDELDDISADQSDIDVRDLPPEAGEEGAGPEDFDLAELLDDLPLEEPGGEPSAAADELPENGVEDFSFDDLDGLVEDEVEIQPVEETPADDAFDLDDFGDLDDLIDTGESVETSVADDEGIPSLVEPDEISAEPEYINLDDVPDIDSLDDFEMPADSGETPEADEVFSLDDLDLGEAVENFDETSEADESLGSPAIDEIGESDSGAPDDLAAGLAGLAGTGVDDLDDFNLDDLSFDEGPGDDIPGDDSGLSDASDIGVAQEIGELSVDEPVAVTKEADDFSLDDLGFDEPAEDTESGIEMELEEAGDDTGETAGEDGLEAPGDLEDLGELDEVGDLDDLGELDEIGDLDDLGDFDESGDTTTPSSDEGLDIPDVEAAMEGLGDPDDLAADSQDELSLDEELNFEEELGADVLSDIREVGDESRQFSMDDFGEQYNFKEGESGFAETLGVDLEQLEQSLDEASADEKKPFSLENEDLTALLRTLGTLPRNLKIAIEELLADERRNPEDLMPLINGLIEGETPKSLAARFKTITKRKIELPRSYEKRSGQALEARRAALAYRLLREGWPVIRLVLLIIAVAWSLGAVVFMWVYRPLKAESLYQQGLEAIAVDEIDEAVEYFYDAWDGWPLFEAPENGDRIADSPVIVKGWKARGRWLDYARSLRRRKHWDSADRFYSGYLAVRPDDKNVRLEYAEFLSAILGRYQRAVDVLEGAPSAGSRNPDRDYTLAAGDVYLRWAEDNPVQYEQARYRYAKVLETSRNDEKAILSMMRYHLRLANDSEIETLLPIFRTESPGQTKEPELAAEVYAGLGDWHLIRGNTNEARRFLNLALTANPSAPEPHFVDARYWRSIGGRQEDELEAYKRTLVALDERESLDRKALEMRILSLGGMGRLYYSRSTSLMDSPAAAAEARSLATGNYTKALDLYEDARERNQLGASPAYGRLYMEIGDVLYDGASSSGDLLFTMANNPETISEGQDRRTELRRAEQYYNEAEKLFDIGGNGNRLPDGALYRRAYARYNLGIDGALVDFHRVARQRPEDYDARLALASVLLQSGDYEAARSQYARSLELLDEELRRSGGVLNPLEKQGHVELLIRYIVAWNNLGVGRARTAARGGGEDDYAAALGAFTMASEYHDQVYTDLDGLTGRGAIALRDVEDRRVKSLDEEAGRNLLMEKGTLPYRNRLRLLGLETAEADENTYLMYSDIPSDILGYSDS